jgi:diaminopimelate epimerase
MLLNIYKTHGSGNTFLLIDLRNADFVFSADNYSKLTLSLCLKEQVDGVLYVLNSNNADAQMIIYNADGSQASMCGNGIRIVGRYMIEQLNQQEVCIENVTLLNYIISKESNLIEEIQSYRVQLPSASFDTSQLPMNVTKADWINRSIPDSNFDQLQFTAIAMPNPHIIAHVTQINFEQLEKIGQYANNHSNTIFPYGVNVSFVQNISNELIFVATYERGVGITNSCGTAMCASSISSILNGYTSFDKEITVINKGGFVKTEVHKDYSTSLNGNATYISKGNITIDISNIENTQINWEQLDFKEEIEKFLKIKNYANNLINNTMHHF